MKRFLCLAAILPSLLFADSVKHFTKTYARGDDDLAFSYRTAYLTPTLTIRETGNQVVAEVHFKAVMSTKEAQGFAESVRFGLREAQHLFKPSEGGSFEDLPPRTQSVSFQYYSSYEAYRDNNPVDARRQQLATQLSNQAIRNGGGVAGNREEALHGILAGKIELGALEEGEHQGILYVLQISNTRPVVDDSTLAVRHLLKWHANVKDGKVAVQLSGNRVVNEAASIEIAAPRWASAQQPHRVGLRAAATVIDGKTFQNTNVRYGSDFPQKKDALFSQDKGEYRKEYTLKERFQLNRERRRGR